MGTHWCRLWDPTRFIGQRGGPWCRDRAATRGCLPGHLEPGVPSPHCPPAADELTPLVPPACSARGLAGPSRVRPWPHFGWALSLRCLPFPVTPLIQCRQGLVGILVRSRKPRRVPQQAGPQWRARGSWHDAEHFHQAATSNPATEENHQKSHEWLNKTPK